jgi:tetratricopeptide (TPR) repeat protein
MLLRVTVVLAGFMLASALYLLLNRLADGLGWTLLAAGSTSLPSVFQAILLAHTGIGLLAAALVLVFVLAHLPRVWRRRHGSSILTGSLFVGVAVVLVVTGLFILTEAASQENRWAWWLHVACAALIPLGYLAHRLVSLARPARSSIGRYALAVAGAGVLLVAAHVAGGNDTRKGPEAQIALDATLGTGPSGADRSPEEFSDSSFVAADFVPPQSLFFPSPATTTSGGLVPARVFTPGDGSKTTPSPIDEVRTEGFASEAPIGAEGCVRCHPDTVEQWSASAHRFASFNNPFYEASVRSLRADGSPPNEWIRLHQKANPEAPLESGPVKSKWCAGCHDPALLFTGLIDKAIDRVSREAQAGLTCLACHAIDRLHGRTGNANYNIDDTGDDPYLFADAPAGSWRAFVHDMALKAKPTVHKRRLLKPLHSEPEFCATCHKVRLTEPVNEYRWLRGQDEYDNWHDSGISLNAARTFYLPESRRVCQDCHMPLEPAPRGDLAAEDGLVRSHRFLAANTALPYVRGDSATLRDTERFLRDGALSVDVFAIRRGDDRTPLALDGERRTLEPGERVVVDVVVRNRAVGHTFPGGTNDSNQGWLEVELLEGDGRILAKSGSIAPNRRLDSLAHVYGVVLLDREGRRIQRRNGQDIYVTAASNVIGPGTADVAHYEFVVPERAAGGNLTVRARLLWRKFDRAFTEFAYAANPEGFRRFADVPDLPVTEIATGEASFAIASGALADPSTDGETGTDGSAKKAAARDEDWTRYNDYGIALLLEGNTRLAMRAFDRVRAAHPDRTDGPLNMARTALRDGNLNAAYDLLQEAEGIRPGDPRAAWVWGQVLQEDGRYEDAILAFRRVLEVFPEDRAAWRNLGRTLYLHRQYEEALVSLDRVLRIDPEDRVAHYHRMLVLRALGREVEAAAAEAAYERYRIDEAAQAVAGAYRRAHPGVNLMAQPIHTHRLERVAGE